MKLIKNKKLSKFSNNYFNYLSKLFKNIDNRKIEKLGQLLTKARNGNKNVFVIGNGGGAVTATAMSNDLGFDILKKTKKKSFKIVSLTDNNAITTAISNDIGFENIFISQLKTFYSKGDLLIILSASGNSKNLIKAAQWVKNKKGIVFGILGFDGGKLIKICSNSIHIKNNKGEYGPVEDIQLIINHILAHYFQDNLKKS